MKFCPKCGTALQNWPYGLAFCTACNWEENRRKDPERVMDMEIWRDWIQKHGGMHGHYSDTDKQND